jgi:hypothetical protein
MEETKKDIISCDLSITDAYGDTTRLIKSEELICSNDISPYLLWFRNLLVSAGFEFVDEIVAITDSSNKEFSSKDC